LARARNPLANYALLALGMLAAGAALALGNLLAA
ncbi:metal-dependent hydrolase, partial [Halobacteriales archaeon QH_10_67_13]